jgi:hypothetical protein
MKINEGISDQWSESDSDKMPKLDSSPPTSLELRQDVEEADFLKSLMHFDYERGQYDADSRGPSMDFNYD